jgi:hypothetical protein
LDTSGSTVLLSINRVPFFTDLIWRHIRIHIIYIQRGKTFQNNIIPILLYILWSHGCQQDGTSQAPGPPLEKKTKLRGF